VGRVKVVTKDCRLLSYANTLTPMSASRRVVASLTCAPASMPSSLVSSAVVKEAVVAASTAL